ncbi:MAG TPA: ATPase domain-containing protein [Thermoplasmata archaeon]|nr:ATPase domain-containing protein [Thermoplasmata archaeon]
MAEEQRAASAAEAMRAQRAAKRDEERKRKEYMERRERHRAEVRAGGSTPASDGPTAPGTASPPNPGPSPGTRLPTFVRGLDAALGGGIPAGHVIVVEGAPGTMKSSLCFWIVAHNCEVDGRRALYVAAEENAGSLLQQMASLGLDLDAAAKGVKILESNLLRKTLQGEKGDWLPPLQALVTKARDAAPVDFLVLDSLDGLEVLAKFEDRRRELFRLFEWLRDLGITTLVVAERPDYVIQGNVLQGRYAEDFLADGVLTMRLHPITDQEVQRRIRIMKMRGTRHETAYLALHVGDGELQVGRVLSV